MLFLGGGWLWLSRPTAEAQSDQLHSQPAVGYLAPDFTLQTLDGESFTLSQQNGTPMVLNFWATWCGPCRNELPALQSAARRYDGQVRFVGVDQGETAQDVQSFVDEFGLTYPIPMDIELTAADAYNVMGLPTTYFVDADGVIRHLWSGEMNTVTLEEGISKIWP